MLFPEDLVFLSVDKERTGIAYEVNNEAGGGTDLGRKVTEPVVQG